MVPTRQQVNMRFQGSLPLLGCLPWHEKNHLSVLKFGVISLGQLLVKAARFVFIRHCGIGKKSSSAYSAVETTI